MLIVDNNIGAHHGVQLLPSGVVYMTCVTSYNLMPEMR
jgi:hypothetical protein